MSFVETILPKQAHNDFRGGRVPFYGFLLLLLPVTFRSMVHFLKDDSGVNSIASFHLFSGTPDPNNVIYMFSSLWGSQQTIMLLIYIIVLLRYRNLIPLMFLLMLVEIGFRWVSASIHPLSEDFYVRTPPGAYVPLFMGLPSLIFLWVSHRNITAFERAAAERGGDASKPSPGQGSSTHST